MSCFKLKVVHFLKNYLNNRVFLSRDYWLIVALQTFDVLKTNICSSRANLLVLKTSFEFLRGINETDSSET